MRWQGGRRSSNIEDRRGMRVGRGVVGGGLGTIILLLVALYFGVDPGAVIGPSTNVSVDAGGDQPYVPATPEEEQMKDFVATVVGYTEDTWSEIFRMGARPTGRLL
jgi:predicted metalloprotease